MTNYSRIKNTASIEEMADYLSSDALCMDDPDSCQRELTCKACWMEYLSRETDVPKSPYKPCPFCGGEAKFYVSQHENSDTSRWHKIKCQNPDCRAEIGDALSGWSPDYDKQVEELKAKWNKRVGETQL